MFFSSRVVGIAVVSFGVASVYGDGCTRCDDKQSPYMLGEHIYCSGSWQVDNQCDKTFFQENHYCQKSCFCDKHVSFDGVECCCDAEPTPKPILRPTAPQPTPKPTHKPTPKPTTPAPRGVNDFDFYNSTSKAFVGLNPINGVGGGFLYVGPTAMDGETFGNVPDSNTGRNNLCTCDCKPSEAGVGCAGWGGIRFRYGSMLYVDPRGSSNGDDIWSGQMQAYQITGDGPLNFLGTDTRFGPGGAAVYEVACTQQDCGDRFAGVFRQYNSPVNCTAGLEDFVAWEKSVEAGDEDDTTCASRCTSSPTYLDWIDYCGASYDTSEETGFSGYWI